MACCGGQGTITGQLNDLVHQVGHNSCGQSGVMGELKDLVNQVGNCCSPPACGGDCPPGCIPMTKPYAQVTMTCPPPIMAPTRPEPVEPLRLPCPIPCCPDEPDNQFDPAERSRYANFYNNYNEDYHPDGQNNGGCCPCPCPPKCPENKYCEDYTKRDNGMEDCPGCPTGFKPCSMKLSPPRGCDPFGVWCAQVQPCPPKPKKKRNNYYNPGPCTRPCCKHWKPKDGPCLYDDPCKASCFNHPPGMKPSGRFP